MSPSAAVNKDAPPARFSEAWFRQNSRQILVAAAVVAALGLGSYLMVRSGQIKEQRAELAYDESQRLLFGGQMQQGEVAMRNVMSRYAGTTPGTLAGLRMTVLKLEQQQIAEALSVLDETEKSADRRLFGASIHALRAAALSDSGLSVRAAQEYLKAAQTARLDRDRLDYRYQAATLFAEGGDREQALTILEDLAGGAAGEVRSRARTYLGELRASPARGGGGTG